MNINIVSSFQVDYAPMHSIAVYRQTDGVIVHIHHVLVLKDTKLASEEDLQKDALTLARRAGVDMSSVAALNLGPRNLDPRNSYRVDVNSRSLVETPAPKDLLDRASRDRGASNV